MTQKFPRYMMATTALHMLGDISSDTPDLCMVHDQDADNYIGHWVFGLGFIGVKFPKISTRDLTPEEVQTFEGTRVKITGLLNEDNEGCSFPLNIK